MAGLLRVPRSRGALSGTLLVLLGIWAGLIPFIGPYFGYAYTPDSAWTYTTGRFWLDILPAVVTLIGGLMLLISAMRPVAILGAWLAAISGAWFIVGGTLAALWASGGPAQGTPVGGTLARTVEQIGFYTGLGVAVLFLAAVAAGRLSVVTVKDVRIGRERPVPAVTASYAESDSEAESDIARTAPV
jgi:hypothetical protein